MNALRTFTCAAALGLLCATPAQAAKPRVATGKWKATYTWSAAYQNSYDLPADQFCSGVHWNESAQASRTAVFPKLKLKLQSGASDAALGSNLAGPVSDFTATGNYYPSNDCGQQPQPASCNGPIDYSTPVDSALLSVVVRGKFAYFTTGLGGGLAEQPPPDTCTDGRTRLAGPALGFAAAADPWGNVVARVPLKSLAKERKLTLTPKPGEFPSDYEPATCNRTPGCEATFDIRRSRLVLTRR